MIVKKKTNKPTTSLLKETTNTKSDRCFNVTEMCWRVRVELFLVSNVLWQTDCCTRFTLRSHSSLAGYSFLPLVTRFAYQSCELCFFYFLTTVFLVFYLCSFLHLLLNILIFAFGLLGVSSLSHSFSDKFASFKFSRGRFRSFLYGIVQYSKTQNTQLRDE